MGTWGPGIYQNDVAEDVKTYFRDQLHWGKTTEEITKDLMDQYNEELLDSDDCCNFWLALADVQWDMGRLLPTVREKALNCIGNDGLWRIWETSPKNAVKRKRALEKLQKKMNSPQPAPRKVTQYKLYQCPWHVGDVYAMPLESEQAKTVGLAGRYLLVEKVDEMNWHPGHQIPVVYLKITENDILPGDLRKYNELKYIATTSERIEISRIKSLEYNNHPEISYIIQSIDENSYLTQYRIALITTSSHVLPHNLCFLGNFSNANHPPKEYVPHLKANIPASLWDQIVNKAIHRFCNQNQ